MSRSGGSTTWVFGYGSLASPSSLARTIGREVAWGDDVHRATLDGWGRRWNYGSPRTGVSWTHGEAEIMDGVMVCLGIVDDPGGTISGVVFAVDDAELAALDRRERDYHRIEVTTATAVHGDVAATASIVTYVPRTSSIERYERARSIGSAAIRQTYWDLVDAAFTDLGDDALECYRRTPAPDVPVIDIDVDMDRLRHGPR